MVFSNDIVILNNIIEVNYFIIALRRLLCRHNYLLLLRGQWRYSSEVLVLCIDQENLLFQPLLQLLADFIQDSMIPLILHFLPLKFI